MEVKSILKSKTFWFNLLTIVIVVANYFGFTPDKELSDKVNEILIGLSPIVNIILRVVTKSGVKLF